MKQIKLFLPAAALLFGIVGAFAFKADKTPESVFFAPIGATSPCNAVSCNTMGTVECVDYDNNQTYSDASCRTATPELWKP